MAVFKSTAGSEGSQPTSALSGENLLQDFWSGTTMPSGGKAVQATAQTLANQPQAQTSQGPGAAPGIPAAPTGPAALPATGIQRQVAGANEQRQTMAAVGGWPAAGIASLTAGATPGQQPTEPDEPPSAQAMGQTSLRGLANKLAQSYGLPVGKGGLVDAQGNFLQTPDQIAAMSGGKISMGTAAARMNYIGAALQRQRQRSSQQKSRGALEAGAKLVQSRGRGSLAAMQSGYYQQLSQLYASEQYEAADFSYFIQEDRFNRALALQKKLAKKARKKSKYGSIGGVLGGVVGGIFGGPVGAGIGGQLGSAIGGSF